VGFILACLGHRYRAVAGSNPALPTILKPLWRIVFSLRVVAENRLYTTTTDGAGGGFLFGFCVCIGLLSGCG
jgi:hypothetical protein